MTEWIEWIKIIAFLVFLFWAFYNVDRDWKNGGPP